MKIRYIGEDLVALKHGKEYEVLSVEHGLYRINTEIGEDYLVPADSFEVVSEE